MSVHLLSSDNEEFKVDKDVAERSVLIKNMLEGNKRKVFHYFHNKLVIYQLYFYRYWRF